MLSTLLKALKLNILRKMPYYAVAVGRTPGIYTSWPQCEKQVKGYAGPVFKKFPTPEEAQQFINKHSKTNQKKSFDANDPFQRIIKLSEKIIGVKTEMSKEAERKRKHDEAVDNCESKKLKVTEISELSKHGKYMFLQDIHGFVHCYTDGSCEGNGTKNACAGLGVYFSEGHALNTAEAVSGRPTNNCGEIQAASLAIKLANSCQIKKLCINTDSQFLINAMTKWLTGWKKKNWKLASGGPVLNKTDFEQLDNLIRETGITIKWEYVKAHNGIKGNERADALARQGAEMYRQIIKNK